MMSEALAKFTFYKYFPHPVPLPEGEGIYGF